MNKKDFWSLVGCNFVSAVLLVELLCGLDKALECMLVWTIISLITHIHILKDYVQLTIEIKEG